MRLLALFVSLALAMTAASCAAPPLQLDGKFEDWSNQDNVATDPRGDATGAFDLSAVSARMEGATLWLRFDTGTKLNLASGPESHGWLFLDIELPRDRTLWIDFRGRQAILKSEQSASTLTWSKLGFASLPTHASDDFELRVDLSSLGVRAGDRLELQFSGSDSLAKPIKLDVPATLRQTSETFAIPKKPGGAVRIASLNTLHQGTADPDRSKIIRKLFEEVDADVFCFNEEWEEEPFRKNVGSVLPDRDGDWNVHWSRSRAIASTLPLQPIEVECPNATAALVTPTQGKPIAIVSVHFECCGYAGSEQDKLRIQQARQLVEDVKRRFDSKPTVILGDYNLVGSRTPLRVLEDAGLNTVMLRSLRDGSATTWRGMEVDSSFWPGRLDYVTKSESARVVGSFTVDTGEFSGASESNGIQRASDHAMLVVDCMGAK